ncbi:hypothetical protein [Chitiniphilus eburneus]|uniref:hypothetical protein n=1 Tax=Chitiniphilus eburneus TaxID=2571148 RepID=UPI0035D0BAD9
MYKLNPRQLAFVKAATQEQLGKFMCSGPVEARTLLNGETRAETYQSVVRGIVVGHEFETHDDAFQHGEGYLQALRFQFGNLILNERALGIDDTNLSIAEQCEEATVRVETILHLGSMVIDYDVLPEALCDLLEDLDQATADALAQDGLSWLPAALCDAEGDAADESFTGDLVEAFVDGVFRHHTFGFLVRVTQPILRRVWQGGGSYTWGFLTTRWFYGEHYEDIMALAVAWGRQNWDAQRAALLASEGSEA